MALPLHSAPFSRIFRGGFRALTTSSTRTPRPTVVEPQPEPETQLQPERWHPKVTPYRFFVVATTIGFGAAKASVSDEGQTWVATTLEWVSAVVIFCMLSAMRVIQMVSNGVLLQFLCSWMV